jgi:hypothetical protein
MLNTQAAAVAQSRLPRRRTMNRIATQSKIPTPTGGLLQWRWILVTECGNPSSDEALQTRLLPEKRPADNAAHGKVFRNTNPSTCANTSDRRA